jgi:integrase
MAATINLTLDTRRVKQRTGKYPLKLHVTFQRKIRRYQTVFEFTSEDYKKLSSSRLSGELLERKEELKKLIRSAEEAVHALDPFTFADFERSFILNNRLFHQRKGIKDSIPKSEYLFDWSQYAHRFPIFKEPPTEPGTLLYTTLSYIDRLLQEHRIGSAVSYQTMYYALKKFRGNVRLVEINVAWLTQYEAWMLAQEYSKTTIGIYLRSLRAIFNEAIAQELIKREKHYPFGRRKYQIPTGRNVKKALNLEDVARIYYYVPEDSREERARDFWLFSYLANGMNPKDIAFLKFKNIVGEFLIFERAKTEKATRNDPKPISVFISEEMWQIIRRWGNKDEEPNSYIFQVLTHGITPIRQYELVELFIRSVNDWMAVVRKKLGIEKSLTTYVARHTFSTVLKRSGVSTEFIQEALGHTSIRTTENYLDSFEKEVKKEYAIRLLDFKKDE